MPFSSFYFAKLILFFLKPKLIALEVTFLGHAIAAWEVENGTHRGANALFSEEEEEPMPLLASHTSATTNLVEKGSDQI